MVDAIFLAVDVDNEGNLDKEELKNFTADLLKGITGETRESRNECIDRYKITFSSLDDHIGEMKEDDLSKFLRELLKVQIKDLQELLEKTMMAENNVEYENKSSNLPF